MEKFLKEDADTDARVIVSDRNKHVERKYFFRQLIIASGAWSMFFCTGMQLGAPTVVVPQLRQANITVTEEMTSWLSSAFSYGAIPWIFLVVLIARGMGRKKACLFTSATTILSCIGFYFSTNPTHLLIVEAGFSITQGAIASVVLIAISEYTSPEYRGMFLGLKSACYAWGIWVSNAIGTFTTWRYIPVVAFFVSLQTFLTILFWPESPHWLASKYRFAECKKAHRWLKGEGKDAERELDTLVQSKTEESYVWKDLKRKEFLMPYFLAIMTMVQFHVSGKFVIAVYALDIMKKLTENESTMYAGMLILDGVTVFSAYVGCVLIKFFKRRSMLLYTSCAGITCLLVLSLYRYLVITFIVSENVYLSVFLLGGFCLAFSSGPLILSSSLYGELTPCRYKSIIVLTIGLEHVLLLGTMAKLAPLCIKLLGLHGLFLLYGILSAICMCVMYFYLPETKDKTLLEIEEYFKSESRRSRQNV